MSATRFVRQGPDRRRVLAGTVSCLALGAGASSAQQPSVAVVPFAAGGVLDSLARIVTQDIAGRTGRSFVVENRPGANGGLAARSVAQAPPEGQAWLFGHDAVVTVNPALFARQAGFDPRSDLKPVRALAQSPSILVVHPDFRARTLADLVVLGRRDEIAYASGGIGSAGHVTMEQFGRAAGLKLRHVPYRGGAPAINDLVAGQVQAAFLAIGNAMAQVEAGKLRALAVSGRARSSQAPDVPSVAESGHPDFESVEMYMVLAPSRLSDATAEGLGREIDTSLGQAEIQSRIRQLGIEPVSMGAAACRVWLDTAAETKARLIAEIGLKAQ